MKTKKIDAAKDVEVLVTCSTCIHFARDTDGISRCRDTGEYFMGVCSLGLTPDTPIKQFSKKRRVCRKHKSI